MRVPRLSMVSAATAAVVAVGRIAALIIGVAVKYGVTLEWSSVDTSRATSVPSCDWPLQVQGEGTHEQAGLIRCYVRAVAHRDLTTLSQLVTNMGKLPTMHPSDVRQSRDALSGTATATFTPNNASSADMNAVIRYADGAVVYLDLQLANVMSAHSWRVAWFEISPHPIPHTGG
jgi:hypothetical protein